MINPLPFRSITGQADRRSVFLVQVGGLTAPVRAGGLAFPMDGDAGRFFGS
jgi:hypothetical protein